VIEACAIGEIEIDCSTDAGFNVRCAEEAGNDVTGASGETAAIMPVPLQLV